MKRLMILSIMVLMTFCAISQTSNGRTCIPDSLLRKAAIRIEQGKVDSVLLQAARNEITALYKVTGADSVLIGDQRLRLLAAAEMNTNKDAQLKLQLEENYICAQALKKAKRKKQLSKGVTEISVVAAVILGILYILK